MAVHGLQPFVQQLFEATMALNRGSTIPFPTSTQRVSSINILFAICRNKLGKHLLPYFWQIICYEYLAN